MAKNVRRVRKPPTLFRVEYHSAVCRLSLRERAFFRGAKDNFVLGRVLRLDMPRLPDQCPHRVVSDDAPSADHVHCEVLRQRCELPTTQRCWVAPAACVACCQQADSPSYESPEDRYSPVMASLMLAQLSRPDCDTLWSNERRLTLSRDAIEQLSCIAPDSNSTSGNSPRTRVWAVGVLTAPRKRKTLEATLYDLGRAGFADIQLFAEPGTEIPAGFQHLPVTRQGRALGVFGNTMTALSAL